MTILDLLFALTGLACGFALGWMVLSARMARQSGYNASLKERFETANAELESARRELTESRERVVVAEAERRALEKQQAQLQTEFKNIATAVMNENSKNFSTQSADKIGVLLTPLRERIGEFQKLVSDSFAAQRTEQNSLKGEIQKIVLQADNLTKALKGDVKAQGNWGEIMLERILEESGLRKDEDYIIQGIDMGLSGAEGNRLKPDVIVNLPDGKHIIIDAKVSLTAYERYCSTNDASEQELHLRDFLKSIRAHVAGLESKRYQDIDKLGTPDFVMMFMPVEGAYSLAVQRDIELHSHAWGKKIVLVCPTTLFATLQTVASLWKIERQNQNAQEIARQGGVMYDKFVGFTEDMQNIGKLMSRMQDGYDQAMNKLKTGRGNLISSAQKLKQLDVKSTKSLPIESDEETEAQIESIAS